MTIKIAIASGKGGTGKTTIATSLASCVASTHPTWYLDCDVEAPNGHIFLKPELTQEAQAVIRIPEIQVNACTLCRTCVQVCQFNALAMVGKTIMVFPQLCHGCGSCTWNCPEGAIEEVPNPIGLLQAGRTAEGIHFMRGLLTISEPMPTPIIRQLKHWQSPPPDAILIHDAPPGASCSVVETLRGVDFVLLVTEPTPFGIHDLKQMLGIIAEMKIPAGVVINRENGEYEPLSELCMQNDLPVLMKVPYDRSIAEGLAEGKKLIDIDARYKHQLLQVFDRIQGICQEEVNNSEPPRKNSR